MPVLEYGELRGNFVRAHPDAMLADFKGAPQEVSGAVASRRDCQRGGFCMRIGRGPVSSPRMSASVLGLPTRPRHFFAWPAWTGQRAMNRVHAVMVALSWTGHLEWAHNKLGVARWII